MRLIATSLVIVGFLLALTPAQAQGPAKTYDPRTAFAEADKNGDGEIDHEEMYERIVEVFYFADANKDGYLSVEEFKQFPLPDDFRRADTNGDGRISLREYMRLREQDFEAADKDHDEVLSLDEVITAYEGKKKK